MDDLYIIHMKGTDFYKIGKSSQVEDRMRSLQHSNPCELELILKKKGYGRYEKSVHNFCQDFRTRGEWFQLSTYQIEVLCKNLKRLTDRHLELEYYEEKVVLCKKHIEIEKELNADVKYEDYLMGGGAK